MKHSFEDKPSVPKCNLGTRWTAAGATIWVRVRKIGTKGETGGWSDPASIMVT